MLVAFAPLFRAVLPALFGSLVVATVASAQGAAPTAIAGSPAPVGTVAAPVGAAATAKPKPKPKPAPAQVTALSADPAPTYSPATVEAMKGAINRYRAIVATGGWPTLPAGTKLKTGDRGPLVAILRKRLAVSGDVGSADGDVFDAEVREGVKQFQQRHGLVGSGLVAAATLHALNVSAEDRLAALEKSLQRLDDSRFGFGERYVIVNIPSASVEAVEGQYVRRRHVAVVGKPDRPSPLVETRITTVNFNPTWTVPTSIIKKDIIPKMRKDPQTLQKMRIKMLNGRGEEVDPRMVDWNTERAVNYTLRQDSGAGNSLGQVRIDMPNREAVYMHDTPSKRLFLADARFHSSGCVRVADVRDFVTWLLEQQGFTRDRVDENFGSSQRKDVRMQKPVPVAWVYLTGWASPGGVVNFRDDIYGLDLPGAPPVKVVRPADRPAPTPVPEAESQPPEPSPASSFFGLGTAVPVRE